MREYSEARRYVFLKRVIDRWNKLPEEVVSAPSTSAFKTEYDEYEKHRQLILRNNRYNSISGPWGFLMFLLPI